MGDVSSAYDQVMSETAPCAERALFTERRATVVFECADMDKLFETGVTNSNTKRLIFSKHAVEDQAFGVASIFSCLSLVIGLIDDKIKSKVLEFLGFDSVESLMSLRDPARLNYVLLSIHAARALAVSNSGARAMHMWENMGASFIPVERNAVEHQINKLVNEAFDTKDDMFQPYSLVKKEDIPEFLAALVSIESIKVSWFQELGRHEHGLFTTSDGERVPAIYAVDKSPRNMKYMTFGEGGALAGAVMLECKPNETTGQKRSMIFVLPRSLDVPLDLCLDDLATTIQTQGFAFATKLVDFKFPKFHAKATPFSIKEFIQAQLPEIFEVGFMKEALTDMAQAKVGDVQHCATIKADRKGAVAQAVTVATLTYRSVVSSPVPVTFHCDRPFISLLMDTTSENPSHWSIEFVTKHGGGSLDLTNEPNDTGNTMCDEYDDIDC